MTTHPHQLQKKSFQSFDRTTINYEDQTVDRPKETIVLLHGMGGNLRSWDEEQKLFIRSGYRVLAVDLRGHGKSDRSRGRSSFAIANFAHDIHTLILTEHIDHPIIVGHCMGGMVAMTLEGQYPGTSRRLVLVDTNFKAPTFARIIGDNFFTRALLSTFARIIPQTPSYVSPLSNYHGTSEYDPIRICDDILKTTLKGYLFTCRNLLDVNCESLLPGITCPTLVIVGSDDSIFPPDVSRRIANKIPKSTLKLIDDANHVIVQNNPEALVQAIVSFLEET